MGSVISEVDCGANGWSWAGVEVGEGGLNSVRGECGNYYGHNANVGPVGGEGKVGSVNGHRRPYDYILPHDSEYSEDYNLKNL